MCYNGALLERVLDRSFAYLNSSTDAINKFSASLLFPIATKYVHGWLVALGAGKRTRNVMM